MNQNLDSLHSLSGEHISMKTFLMEEKTKPGVLADITKLVTIQAARFEV